MRSLEIDCSQVAKLSLSVVKDFFYVFSCLLACLHHSCKPSRPKTGETKSTTMPSPLFTITMKSLIGAAYIVSHVYCSPNVDQPALRDAPVSSAFSSIRNPAPSRDLQYDHLYSSASPAEGFPGSDDRGSSLRASKRPKQHRSSGNDAGAYYGDKWVSFKWLNFPYGSAEDAIAAYKEIQGIPKDKIVFLAQMLGDEVDSYMTDYPEASEKDVWDNLNGAGVMGHGALLAYKHQGGVELQR